MVDLMNSFIGFMFAVLHLLEWNYYGFALVYVKSRTGLQVWAESMLCLCLALEGSSTTLGAAVFGLRTESCQKGFFFR